MTPTNHHVRRATLDDLPGLKALWSSMHFPVKELEKRLTEFQVVESAGEPIIGAMGVQLSGPHGWLHSEAYRDFALADEVRPLLMERIQSLCSNHGVFRLWTREKAPFWTHCGFQPATPELLKKLPEPWAQAGGHWFTHQLKDEAAPSSIEKELALFMESEKQRTQRAFQQARALKSMATLLAVVFAMFVLVALVYLFRKNPGALIPRK